MKQEATEIVKKLQEKGFVAYFAGGCVRDILMRNDPHDIDIATSAKPDQVEKIFQSTHPIGKQFGTILVRSGAFQFEVTSFRVEGEYKDGRRPSSVYFSNAKEDALRRDFTINGIFYNPARNSFIDYVDGREDIKKGVIKFIGNPTERINEDKLRLIRAIRFKITLGFQYDTETFTAVRKNSAKIREVSAERVRDELNKILLSPNRHQGLVELSESKLLQHIIPELENMKSVPQPAEYHHEGDCFTHIYLALKSLEQGASLHLCWATLLHDIAKPLTIARADGKITFYDHATKSAEMARKILKRLKFSNIEINEISYLIHYHMSVAQIDQMRPGKRFAFLTDPRFSDLIRLVEADSKGTYPINLELVEKMRADMSVALAAAKKHENLIGQKRLVTGDDLISLGVEDRHKYRDILEKLYDMQIEGKFKNKTEAIEYIKTNYK